jgi:hypothetical protein
MGKPIEDDDLISFIVSGLNPSFNSFITSSFATRDDPLNFEDFQDELLSHEMVLNQQQTIAPDTFAIAPYTQKPGTQSFPPKQKSFQNMRYPPQEQNPKFSSHPNTFAPTKRPAPNNSAPQGRPDQPAFTNNFSNNTGLLVKSEDEVITRPLIASIGWIIHTKGTILLLQFHLQ